MFISFYESESYPIEPKQILGRILMLKLPKALRSFIANIAAVNLSDLPSKHRQRKCSQCQLPWLYCTHKHRELIDIVKNLTNHPANKQANKNETVVCFKRFCSSFFAWKCAVYGEWVIINVSNMSVIKIELTSSFTTLRMEPHGAVEIKVRLREYINGSTQLHVLRVAVSLKGETS